MLEPSVDELVRQLRHVVQNRDEALHKGKEGRRRAEGYWTWKHAADRALERIEAVRRKPIVRFQEKVDGVVLLNFEASVSFEEARATVESLLRNSYANLKIYLHTNEQFTHLAEFDRDLVVQLVNSASFSSTLATICREALAPYLVIASSPMQFSKHWFPQIRSIAERISSESLVITPSVDLKVAAHCVEYSGNSDDRSFQQFARLLWRNYRGQYEQISALPMACAVLTWSCLKNKGDFLNETEWFESLRGNGTRIFWAKDTFVKVLR